MKGKAKGRAKKKKVPRIVIAAPGSGRGKTTFVSSLLALLKKHGEDISWRKLLHCDGETGRCQIYVDEYEGRDGQTRQSNKVKKFFDKEEQAPKKAFKKGDF